MQIEWIQGVDFRCYRTLSYSPAPQLNILTGPNGQGKTNLLEGLALLAVGRSFRGAKPAEMLRWGTGVARVSGEVRHGESTRLVRREIGQREDGTWGVTGDACSWARVVPFSWQDVSILNGPPQARRNFIDGFAGKLLPAHLTTLARYRQILARRNHLLQSGMDDGALRETLAPWDDQLAAVGIEIVSRRRQAVEESRREVARIYPDIGGKGILQVEYRSVLAEGATVGTVVEALGARLREERRRGQTLVGPHRDDLAIEIDGHDARAYGSRGQQRLVALALRLAEAGPVAAAVGSRPILLLDDALSELDPDVQQQVLSYIGRTGQVFLTTAEGTRPAAHAAWWDVRAERVEEMGLATAGAA